MLVGKKVIVFKSDKIFWDYLKMLKHESRVKLVTKNDCNGHEINGSLHPSFACCVEFSSLVLMLRIGLPTNNCFEQ